MRVKTIGWFVGSLGLLFGAGTAWGNQEGDTASGTSSTSSDMSSKQAGMGSNDCKDAGVTVAFKTGSSELDQNARGALDGVATWMKANPGRTLHLEGFADTSGDTEANLVLSSRRAEGVKSYLIEHGVDSSKVMTVGRGEEADHLPANGRAVTFLACQPAQAAPTVAENETPPAPAPEATNPPPPPTEPSYEAVPPPAPAPVEVVPPPPAPKQHYGSNFGFAMMAGGGFQDFTNSNMRALTQSAGGWDARLIAGTNSIVGLEAAYIGSAQAFQGLGPTNNTPLLVSNGVEGTARLNIPLRVGYHLIEPYGFAGVGYAHYTISNFNSNAQRLSSFGTSSDDVMNIPVGGGFAYGYKGFIADARAGWTATYYQNILNAGTSNGTLDHWQVGGNVGFRF